MIDSLTAEQTADMKVTADRWIKHGLSTEPIDKDKAIAAVNLLYSCAKLPPPKEYIFLPSPAAGKAESKKYGEGMACYGQHDAAWVAFCDFFNRHFGLAKEAAGLIALAEHCGWCWCYDDLAIITDRAESIKFDERNLLHCADGPAIRYRDGFSIYSWHGTKIPADWITKGVDAKTALTHTNIEQRRAACEILGWGKILDELKAVTIDEDGDPEIGTLLEVDIPDIGKERFIRVRCGTGRDFAIPVPPQMKTAIQAQAWMVGLDETDFMKPEIRT